MTGFGFRSISFKDFKLEISIKSVNSRFLDIKFYTPAYYMVLEPELQKLISQKCKRGYFVVRMDRWPQKPVPLISFDWNKKQALKWKKLYESFHKELKFKSSLSLGSLINREGVLQLTETPQNLSLKERKQVKENFSKALNACILERKREGLVLKKDILSQLRQFQSLIQKIGTLNTKQKKNYIKKKEKIITKNKNYSKELALETEKFDIHEEIVRMKGHLKHFKRIAVKSLDAGRKMDFYIQEILREMNTMGSKSHISSLTLSVVEGKFILEKIKEQVQNVE